jgi:hypothetical protein
MLAFMAQNRVDSIFGLENTCVFFMASFPFTITRRSEFPWVEADLSE